MKRHNDFDIPPSKKPALNEFLRYLKDKFKGNKVITLNGYFKSYNIPHLHEQIDKYVVLSMTNKESSDDIFPSDKHFAKTIEDNEEFLMELWCSVVKKPTPTHFNAEIHVGPWLDLLEAGINRYDIIYLVKYCILFKKQPSGTFIALSSDSNLYAFQNKAPIAKKQSSIVDNTEKVDKGSILYKRHGQDVNKTLEESPIKTVSHLKEFSHLTIKIIENLEKYNKRALQSKVRIPKNEDGKPCKIGYVAWFLTKEITKLIPRSLLGSKHNVKEFEKQLSLFLPFRGIVKVQHLIKGLKISEIPWLRTIDEPERRLSQLISCVSFLYNVVVKHMLQLHFYITEMSGMPTHRLYYYPQQKWRSKIKAETESFLISHTEKADFVINKAMPWRFVPKPNESLRPIINLKQLNKSFQVTHSILNYKVHSGTIPLMRSRYDWIVRFTEFVESNKGKSFFMAKADISACYDNANRDKVLEILKKYLYCSKLQSFMVNKSKFYNLKTGKVKYKCVVNSADNVPALSQVNDCKPEVMFEGVKHESHTTSQVFDSVKKLFSDLYLHTGKDSMAKFTSGIPQGSSCSLDLCDMLLNDLIETKLNIFMNDENSILFRYVDDFLFVSTDQKLEKQFVELMGSGFADYGVKCNPEKIVERSNLESENDNFVYLGIGIEPKTMKLLPPKPDFVNSDLIARGDIEAVKRRLTMEMEKLVGVLRTFKGFQKQVPLYLESRVARNIGYAIVLRMKAFKKIYSDMSEKKILEEIIVKILLPLMQKKSYRFNKDVAKRAYKDGVLKLKEGKGKNQHIDD